MWLVKDGPEVVSSWVVAEYPVPEVVVCPAVEQDVGYCLSCGSAIASGAGYIWYIVAVEEVPQPDLFGPQLHEESTVPLFEAFV